MTLSPVRQLRRADAALFALRGRLSPGQRWTSALALTLAMAVLLFGSATTTRNVVPGASESSMGAAGVAATEPPRGQPYARPVDSAPQPTRASRPTRPMVEIVRPRAQGSGRAQVSVPNRPAPAASVPVAPATIAVTALVPAPSGERCAVPGRTEVDIARVFLESAGFLATLVEVGATSDGLCEEVAARGPIALVGDGIDPTLVDCLVDADVAVIGFHPGGDRPPEPGRLGQVLSTRRGNAASMLDLGRWGAAARTLEGAVGIVATDADRDWMSGVVPALEELGIDVSTTAYLPADEAAAVAPAVADFAARGVNAVVFAAPVDLQRRWVAQHVVVDPDVRFVVSDVHDAVVEEAYPPVFDGALAHTSLRTPWFARDHGETPEQASCRATWEEGATPPTSLSNNELRLVFAWCQHVALVDAALEATVPLGEAVRLAHVRSPLTSDVGPLPDGGWGPQQDAVVRWRAACSCWTEERGFEPRS